MQALRLDMASVNHAHLLCPLVKIASINWVALDGRALASLPAEGYPLEATWVKLYLHRLLPQVSAQACLDVTFCICRPAMFSSQLLHLLLLPAWFGAGPAPCVVFGQRCHRTR